LKKSPKISANTLTRRYPTRNFPHDLLEDYRGAIFAFDEAAAFEWRAMMARMKNPLPPYDGSLIGAIARSCGMTVITRNFDDFRGCGTVNPWDGVESAEKF
jgi:predicted nucleic acid-binding protein